MRRGIREMQVLLVDSKEATQLAKLPIFFVFKK
jgi:hypothetical protein